MRSGLERKGHWAPTDARNFWIVWWSSVAIVATWVVGDADLRIERGEL
jgi:hypothetical protein